MHTAWILPFLILFFGSLVLTQLLQSQTSLLLEGMETQTQSPQYKDYQPKDAMMLAQQNAGNIEFLKERMDKLDGVQGQVTDLSNNLQTLQTQVAGLMQAQQDYATQLTGGSAPTITGAVEDDDGEKEEDDGLPTEAFSLRFSPLS